MLVLIMIVDVRYFQTDIFNRFCVRTRYGTDGSLQWLMKWLLQEEIVAEQGFFEERPEMLEGGTLAEWVDSAFEE